MTVYIDSVRYLDTVRTQLEADRWSFAAADEGGLLARHPDLQDEWALRERLNTLGLLTSSGVRIEFRPSGRRVISEA